MLAKDADAGYRVSSNHNKTPSAISGDTRNPKRSSSTRPRPSREKESEADHFLAEHLESSSASASIKFDHTDCLSIRFSADLSFPIHQDKFLEAKHSLNHRNSCRHKPTVKICLCLVGLVLFLVLSRICDGQFISHFNSRGLRGNITFVIKNNNGSNSELHIESFIQTDNSASSIFRPKADDAYSESSGSDEPEVKFEWRLHANPISTQALLFCSGDELGAQLSDQLAKSLYDGRPIILNRVNQWIVPIDSGAKELGSLIWGKSISIRLSDEHKPIASRAPESIHSAPQPIGLSPVKLRPIAIQSNATEPALVKPKQQRVNPFAIPNAANKPTFAPRQRPSSTAPQLRILSIGPAATLPKPQSLVLGTNTTTFLDAVSDSDLELPESKSAETTRTQTSSTSTTTTTTTTTTTPPPDTHKQKQDKLAIISERIVKNFGRTLVCGNVIDSRGVKTAEAIFESQVAGRVTLRGNEDGTTLLLSNLYHIKSKITSRHDWKILTTDILDDRRHEDQCKYLEVLFDPDNVGSTADCKRNDHSNCPIGDLTKKHGQIQIAGLTKNGRATYVDLNLPISSLEGSRSMFLVLYEVSSLSSSASTSALSRGSNILGCAQIKPVDGRKVEANFNMDGVRGSIKISQRHSLEAASVSFNLFGLESNTKHQSIRELPLMARTSSDNGKLCSNLGSVYDPYRGQRPSSNPGDRQTIDMFEVGNLSSKYDGLSVVDSEYEDHYMAEYIDLSLQLFGPTTIVGRSVLIHKNNGDPWVCSNLMYADESVSLAAATFHYPVVGRVYFQQLANDPSSETSVLVEVYNPNSERDSENHNWALHLRPAMADFYNWSERCASVGEIYDPLGTLVTGASNSTTHTDPNNRHCQQVNLINEPLRCRTGDLTLKSGQKISLPTAPTRRTRTFYTDLYLPLSQANSIVGRSIVIYDENSPKQRGNRLACSTIKLIHPMKASVRSWNSGPTIPSALTGYMEFEQTMETAATKIKIDLGGFNGNVENYAIHQVWTQDDREFPCSNDSLYDIFDPYDSENSLRLPPSAHYGSLATVDRVKVGDLSKKHGTFEGLQGFQKSVVDSNAPLFAPHSIIGRSVVLRAAVNDFRWVCGNIELEFDNKFSRQIVGVASFDEPRSKIAGFVRFLQLEHKDGSLSDTLVQVDLKMQTNDDRTRDVESSHDHNWAIFVNQVGADAFITADEVRCIAAGFKWNPYLAQDNLESYPVACSPKEQLACAMGDLGMRHGLLTLGPNNRRAFSDSNLPLVGNYSVMGRSLVIFDNKRPNVKLACANIMPDIHLKSNVVIKRTPSFTVARFVEQMRSLLGAAEWLMVPELKATKPVANGECVQMTIHFYGQKAHQMQIELNNLITLGTVRKSTQVGSDKISTHYKLCRAGQAQLTSSTPSTIHFGLSVNILAATVIVANLLRMINPL